jgi:hypothetical protein
LSVPNVSRRARRLAVASTFALLATTAWAGIAAAAPGGGARAAAPLTFADGSYIVTMKVPGATTYKGGKTGLAATHITGKKFTAKRPEVTQYQSYLTAQQDAIAKRVGATAKDHITLASSSFTAKLTGKQAQALAGSADILAVSPDTARHVDLWNTPQFLGLSGKNGLWAKLGGTSKAGDGVVIGDLDTGIWPTNPLFAGAPLTTTGQGKWGLRRVADTTVMNKADGEIFVGNCQPGDQWQASYCSSKIISARYYPDTFVANVPVAHRGPGEVISALDGAGHGSHTASTAAGNNGVELVTEGIDFGKGSGVAPAAKLAVYKVCFSDDDPNTGDCYTSSSLLAVDDAIADGVDVINYSISGATNTVIDPVELAFEGAAEAGIFISTSAGNSGPAASTVAHNSPWETTVAASTHARLEDTVVLGDGSKIKGASVNRTAVAPTSLVDSSAVALASAPAADAKRCFANTLDPAKTAGKIVVCTRGVNDRVAKSAEVKRAGGVGMILANPTANSLDPDFHSVPTVHIDDVGGAEVAAYLASAGAAATASFGYGDSTGGAPTPLPQIAGFSSRGPALANDSDLLKPDISAPGVGVLAAVSPAQNSGRDFDLYSGTSMAAPQIAGLGALILGKNPTWSPMRVKSAMMTTAYDLFGADGTKSQDPFAQGAGHVDPTRFLNPGLTVESTSEEWRGYLTGQGLDTGVAAIKASDLNVPSIARGQVASSTTVTRTFTGLVKGTWKVSVKVPGFKVSYPREVKITKVGNTDFVTLVFTRTTAPLGQFATGFLTLSGPTKVRLPIALRPVAVSAPAAVHSTGAAGPTAVPFTAGFTGNLQVNTAGLVPGTVTNANVAQRAAKAYIVTIPAGTSYARFDEKSADADADLDLTIYTMNAAGTALTGVAGQSATSAADEQVNVTNPTAGKYYVKVAGFGAAPGKTSTDFTLTNFAVNPAAYTGGLTVTPNPVAVTQGKAGSFSVSWSGLDAATPYLGLLSYDGALSPTVVSIN